MQTPAAKAMTVDAKLTTHSQPVSEAVTIQGAGQLDVVASDRIYLRMYAGQVSSMVREGNDLLLVGPEGEVIRLVGFYEGNEPRDLLLMDGDGGLVRMVTEGAIIDGPMPVYAIGVNEPSPFTSLTSADDGAGLGVLAAGAAGLALAAWALSDDDGDNGDDNGGGQPRDTTPPGAPTDLAFNATGTKLTGKAEPNATVTVRDADGKVLGTAKANADGTFEVTLNPALVDGEPVKVTATDAANNVSDPASAVAPDLTAPEAPSNLVVNANGTKLTGEAEAGSTVTVRDPSGKVVGTAKANAEGKFEVTLNPAQANGETLTATAADTAGNVSLPGTATAPDITPPDAATGVAVSDDGTKVSGAAEPGATVTIRDPSGKVIGTGTSGSDGKFNITLEIPQINKQVVTVIVTDKGNNDSGPANATAPDLTAPDAATDLRVSANGSELTGAGEAGATVNVFGANGSSIGTGVVGVDGRFIINLAPSQIEGQMVRVVLTDAAGNISPNASVRAPNIIDVDGPLEDAPTVVIPEAAGGVTVQERADGIQVEVSWAGTRSAGDKVVLTVSGQPNQVYSLTAADIAAGKAVITLSANLAVGNHTISAVITQGDIQVSLRSTPQTITLLGEGTDTPNDPALPKLEFNNITSDNVLNYDEAQGLVTVSGSLIAATAAAPGFKAGDLIQITANGVVYSTVVDAAGKWTVSIAGINLVNGFITAIAFATNAEGVTKPVAKQFDYNVDLGQDLLAAPTLSIPAADDGLVDTDELNAGLKADVGIPRGAEAGDTVVVHLQIGGKIIEFTKVLAAADITRGTVQLDLGKDFGDGTYAASAFIRDPSGNTSAKDSLTFKIDAIPLDVGTAVDDLSETSLAQTATGNILITGATGTTTVTLSGPTATITSRGEAIVWENAANGDLIGTAGGRMVLKVSLSASGQYTARLYSGIDHPQGEDSFIIPISLNVTDGQGSAVGAINIRVADGAPVVSAPLQIDPANPGLQSGTLVVSMGADGGYMQNVTIDGLQFSYNPAGNSITSSGTSSTVLSYSSNGNILTVTTVRGETVVMDMKTGRYDITVTGREAQPAGDNDPFASMADGGGLLGLIDANLLGVIKLEDSQFFTASDADNNLSSIELTYSALLGLGGIRFVYDTKLMTELGIVVTQNGFSAVLPAYNKITITAADGGNLDNWKLNEFLGSMRLGGGISDVLDIDVASLLSIKATDADGNIAERSNFKLADVGVGAPLLGVALPATTLQGSDNADNLVASDGNTGDGLDNRIYGYGGNDTLEGGKGNDILRGGSGNDILRGGEGNDILIGGTGSDRLVGGAGTDIYRFERGDQLGSGIPTDIIDDFNNAGLAQQGDVLDLADMLQGEGRVGNNAGNLSNYLHFEKTAEGTLIHVSTTGGYVGGFKSSNASSTDQRILLKGVDLTAGFASDTAIINDLLKAKKLIVDPAHSDPDNHGNLNIAGTVVDSDGDRDRSWLTIDDRNLNTSAGNRAPQVGVEAENTLSLLGGNLLGYSLTSQDLLVADADNNLGRVSVEYAPTVAVNLTPLTFAYDATLAAALGYEVRLTYSEGLLNLVAPRAKIEIFSKTGEPLDNAEINTFLKTVHLADSQGGLLSSSLLSANLLNAIVLRAEDVWGESTVKALGSFLDVNLLNSIGGVNGAFVPVSLLNALDFSGNNVGLGDIGDMSAKLRGYLQDGFQYSDVQNFSNDLRQMWLDSVSNSPLAGVVERLQAAFDSTALADFASQIQDFLTDGGINEGNISDFIENARAFLDSKFSGSMIGGWFDHAYDYLSDSAIGRFAQALQEHLATLPGIGTGFSDFAARVQAKLSSLMDGSFLSDYMEAIRGYLNLDTLQDYADEMRVRLSDGFDAADVSYFISIAKGGLENALSNSALLAVPEYIRSYLQSSAIYDLAVSLQQHLQANYGLGQLGNFADVVKLQLANLLDGTVLGDVSDYLAGLFDQNAIAQIGDALRAKFANGVDFSDISEFVADAKAHLTNAFDGTFATELAGKIGEYLQADAIIAFANDVKLYLENRYGAGNLVDFVAGVKGYFENAFELSGLGEIAARIQESLDDSALAQFGTLIHGYVANGFSGTEISDFLAQLQSHIEASFSSSHLGDLADFAQQALSASAIMDFAQRIEGYIEATFGVDLEGSFIGSVQDSLEALFDGGVVAGLEGFIRDGLGDLDSGMLDNVFELVIDQVDNLAGGLLGGLGSFRSFSLEGNFGDEVAQMVGYNDNDLDAEIARMFGANDFEDDSLAPEGTAFSPNHKPSGDVPVSYTHWLPEDDTPAALG